MTAKYTTAEKAAAKRIQFSPALRGAAPNLEWLADFRRIFVAGFDADARSLRRSAVRILRDAERESARLTALAERADRNATDARTVARAVRRECLRAEQEASHA